VAAPSNPPASAEPPTGCDESRLRPQAGAVNDHRCSLPLRLRAPTLGRIGNAQDLVRRTRISSGCFAHVQRSDDGALRNNVALLPASRGAGRDLA
jgi:hypothetical protein